MDSELQKALDRFALRGLSALSEEDLDVIVEAARKVANLPDFDKWYDFLIYRHGDYIDIEDDDPLLEWIRDMLRLLKPEVARDIPQRMVRDTDAALGTEAPDEQ